MKSKVAVACRIQNLCQENNITIHTLAKKAKVSPSTIYSMINEKSQNPGVVSIEMLCTGFGITIRDFFSDELFE